MVPALIQIKVTSAVCSFFAIVTTAVRLYLRRHRYWWDDACAFLSTIFLLLQIAAVFMHVPNPRTLSRTENIAAYYIMAASFYAIIWTARLAILYSVIRIDPNPRTRTFLHRVAVVFMIVVVVLICQLFWVCEPLSEWKAAASPQCPLDKQVAICQLVTDVLADLLLIIAPLQLIRHMSAVDGTRRRLMIIFSTSIVTTIVSLVHAALILSDAGTKVVIAALVEDTFSLIVCNLPVVVTFALRSLGGQEEESHYTGASTFGWRVATRKTTATMQSDTARDVMTVNLRELGRRDYASNAALSQIEPTRTHSGLTDDTLAPHKDRELMDGPRQQRNVVWITTEKMHKGDDDDDK